MYGICVLLKCIDVKSQIQLLSKSACMYISVCVCRGKRHKSGSMEEDPDSPGGEYYHSPSSPASSSRNWTDDMEGGK